MLDCIDMPVAGKAAVAAGIGDAEWQLRVQLAAAYRLVEHFGWTELIYAHLTARVPGADDHFLINRWGLAYDEVTASNLVKIDVDGQRRRRRAIRRSTTPASSSTRRST